MKIFSKAAIFGALLVVVLLPAAGANAEDSCDSSNPYCNPTVPTEGSQDSGAVLPATAEQTPTGGATAVAPAAAPAPAPATNTAPSGALPFTGGDVVGMTVIGAAALGLGTVLVRRSKKAKVTA